MTSPDQQYADAVAAARTALDKVVSTANATISDREAKIAARDDIIAKLKEQNTPPPVITKTVFGINGKRTGQNGITRTPDERRYYGPGDMPDTPPTPYLKSVEQELSVSYKLPPADVITGKYDAKIISWHKAAKAGLPKLVSGRRHRTVPWHEPASEIIGNQFTGQQHRDHVVHIANLLAKEGLTDTFIVCPNYTMGPPNSGANFNPDWLPDVSMAPEGSMMISGDLYSNPGGGKVLATPYGDPHNDLDVLVNAAKKHGFKRVGVLEVNGPRRTFDPKGEQRVAYLDAFTKAIEDYSDMIFDVVDVWEGVGKWDQRFTLPIEWAWLAKLLAGSPQTRV
jgi:hypothetical protein